MTFPWEQLPAAPEPAQPPAVRSVEETVALLQQDFAYAVQYTAVMVRSSRPELQNVVNTRRGQIVPRNECRFSDGTTFELQDLGMPQPGCPEMTVKELLAQAWGLARELGLELA